MISAFKEYLQTAQARLPENAGFMERAFNRFGLVCFLVSAVVTLLLPIPITLDVIARCFDTSIVGVMELEQSLMVILSFLGLGYITALRTNLRIDILTNILPEKTQIRLELLVTLLGIGATGLLGFYAAEAGIEHNASTLLLGIPERPLILATSLGLLMSTLALIFYSLRIYRKMFRNGDYVGIVVMTVAAVVIILLPVLYKYFGLRFSRLLLGGLGFCLLFLLLFLGMPIAFAMMLVGFIGLFIIQRSERAIFGMVSTIPYGEGTNFVMVAIPMFMLMGEIVTLSGISRDMFDCARKWLGHSLPGGLACSTVAGCAAFGAICGDSLATVVTMSGVALPPMRDSGYAPKLSCGALASGGTIAILIPPSMGFIYYSMMTEVSVGALFMAGFLPGILMTAIFIAIIIFMVKRNPELAPATEAYPLREKLRSLSGLIPMFIICVVVIGGITKGFFTPGEGGAIGAVASALYAWKRKTLTLKGILHAIHASTDMTIRIMVVLAAVYVFGAFLTTSRLPALLADAVTSSGASPYMFIFFVIVLYLFLGCVMNIMPMMMLTLPTIFPTVQALGFDGVWFGVLVVILMECGMITPPIGINVFVLSGISDVPMGTIFKGILPFFLGMLLTALLIILFPDIALIVPKMMGMIAV